MFIITLTLVLLSYASDASRGKLSLRANDKGAEEAFQQSFKRFKRTDFTVDLKPTEFALLVFPVRMGDSRVERNVMLDTSLWFSWLASDELLIEHGLTALSDSTGLKVLQKDVCHQYSKYELTGDWCEATVHIGHRLQEKKINILLVRRSTPGIKFLKHVQGVIGLAPKESGEMTYMAQTYNRRGGSLYLSITFNELQQAKVKYTRFARINIPPDLPAIQRVSDERWSIYVDSISVGDTTLCTERCELSFELGCVRAYFPVEKRDLVAKEWKAPVVEGAIELQENLLYSYASLRVKIRSVTFEWPSSQHHFTYTEDGITKHQSTILSHDEPHYALGTEYISQIRLVFGVDNKKIYVGVNYPED